MEAERKEKVVLIGSGNWGSAVACLIGENVKSIPGMSTEVRMWVFEEVLTGLPADYAHLEGQKLSTIINTTHENVKYLPGIKLPENIVAVTDLATAVEGATCLVFVLPHQFLPRLFPDIRRGLGGSDALNSGKIKAISLIKGIDYDEKGLVLISDTIRLGLGGLDTAVLMGANVANEVAQGQFCEATVGCTDSDNAALWKAIFQTDTFRIQVTDDAAAVELCGALKNVVALGAGFSDGLGYGSNTKAAILRIGLMEMRKFCQQFYGSTHDKAPEHGEGGFDHAGTTTIRDETFFESCAVADLITTSYSGRNRKVAEAFVKTGKDWDVLETEMLNGQKLQGTLTAVEVHHVLKRHGALEEYPLFTMIYRIMQREVPPTELVRMYIGKTAPIR